jgi:putative DNA primase/helicase
MTKALKNEQPRKPFHEIVAEKLIEQLKQGTAPWQKPWGPGQPAAVFPMNPTTGQRYKGINAIFLMAQGHDDLRWMTYRQAEAAGAQVRKGERGTPIQYWKFEDDVPKVDAQGQPVRNAQGEQETQRVKLERPRVFHATVFNATQIDGLPPIQRAEPSEQRWSAIERAEAILVASGATITHESSNRAFYRTATDSIHLPQPGQFASADNYYATALHELGHWTGHASRLGRDLSHPFGSEVYAKEELRAEIASMILGDELGIGHDPGQHAAYVRSWIAVLENDPLEIVRAAADAEKIQRFVMSFEQVQQQAQEMKQVPEQVEVTLQSMSVHKPQLEVMTSEEPSFLNVPYWEKNEAKALGAKWDRQEQAWYVPAGVDPLPLARWVKTTPEQESEKNQEQLPAPARQPDREGRQYLAVPYEERHEAKAVGAEWDKVVKSWYVGPQADSAPLQRWAPNPRIAEQEPAMHPRDEFAQAMRDHGLVVEGDHPIMDGKKHRVPVEGGKKGAVDGFYVLFADGHPAGRIINHKTGVDEKWKSKGYSLSPEQRANLQAVAAANLVQRAAALVIQHEQAAARVSAQLTALQPVTEPTPYLVAKGVQVHPGAFTDREQKTTFIPAIDADNRLWSMQYIQEDGTKRFAKDTRKEGCFHAVGGLDALARAPAIVIAEGYATAATLSEVLGFATVAAFDSGNLTAVAKALQARFPDKPVVIAGDDDQHLVTTLGKNPGREKMEQAAEAVGAVKLLPIFAPGEREARPGVFTDFNDLATKSVLGREGVERQVRSVVQAAVEKHAVGVPVQEERKLVRTQTQRHGRQLAGDESVRQRRLVRIY